MMYKTPGADQAPLGLLWSGLLGGLWGMDPSWWLDMWPGGRVVGGGVVVAGWLGGWMMVGMGLEGLPLWCTSCAGVVEWCGVEWR